MIVAQLANTFPACTELKVSQQLANGPYRGAVKCNPHPTHYYYYYYHHNHHPICYLVYKVGVFPLVFLPKCCTHFLVPYACYMAYQPHPP
jgi:hypothetical protein